MSDSRNAIALPASIQPDVPIDGTYTTKLCRGGIDVAVRLYYGAPVLDGQRLDRSPRWCALINGGSGRNVYSIGGDLLGRELHDIERVWPHCAKHPIPMSEYRFLLRRAGWARQYQPDHPAARPWEPVDIRRVKLAGW